VVEGVGVHPQQRGRLGQRPATVSLQQAIIKPQPSDSAKAAARRRATEVLEELRRGGDFEVLARRHSQDPSASQGGMLGWFRQGQMVRPFEMVAYAMRPGDVSGIVETEYGFHIIKLEKVRGPERQARHILIRPEVTPADVEAARAQAPPRLEPLPEEPARPRRAASAPARRGRHPARRASPARGSRRSTHSRTTRTTRPSCCAAGATAWPTCCSSSRPAASRRRPRV
jgi:hypothetical protein